MKLKISTVAIILIVFLFGVLSASATKDENNTKTQDVNVLKTNIEEPEKTIKTQEEQIQRTEKALDELRKQLDAQIKENNRLRELCKKAGIDTTKEIDSNTTLIGRIIYRGKERDEDWFNRMYERFSDKIALAGDKFVDLRTKPKCMSNDFVEVGSIIDASSGCGSYLGPTTNEVISIIGDGEAVIHYQGNFSTDLEYHLCGYNHPLIDGQKLLDIQKLICVGTYKHYMDTVQSFKVWEPKPLTKEQFADAIRSGFELVNHVEKQGKTVKVPIK